MVNFKKIKVSEPKHITDEKEIWYCNEVLPLKCEISELRSALAHIEYEIRGYCKRAKCREKCHEEDCLLYKIKQIIEEVY